jgi:DNA repair protein RadC
MKAKEKMAQYGLPAMTDSELLEILKWKKGLPEYYQSPEYKAAKELIRRCEKPDAVKITNSKNAVEILAFLQEETEEHFYALFLNRANKVISTEFISKGSATGTVVCPQVIARRALELKAQSVILGHNHPSGNLSPSDADKKITQTIKQALNLFQIQTLDHVIISAKGYFSFADEGIL